MQRLRKIFNETENKTIEHTEFMCEKIIKIIEKEFGVLFNLAMPDGNRLKYLNVVTLILMDGTYIEYKNRLIELLKENNLNENTMLFHIIGLINNIGVNDANIERVIRNELVTKFSDLPFHKGISSDDVSLTLKIKSGTIKVFQYDKILNNKELYKVVKSTHLRNHCHEAVDLFKSYYPDGYITTSEIPVLFGGYIYHSYFTTNEGVVDISNNTFYPDKDFNKIYCPNEILKIKTSEFTYEYEKFAKEENIFDDGMAHVLALALNNKRKY